MFEIGPYDAIVSDSSERSTSACAVDARVPAPTGIPVVSVKGTRRSADVGSAAIVVGRGADSTLCVEGRGLSRRHAKLVRGLDNRLTIVDLGSTNGTFVDGMRIEVAAIHPGSHVRLGRDVVLRVHYRDPPSPSTRLDGLTPREVEVAQLLAEGLSNQQIADQLQIARRTVTTHVSRIFSKAGVGSRLELLRQLRAL